jgi:membrane-associated phospholipid phosphatase
MGIVMRAISVVGGPVGRTVVASVGCVLLLLGGRRRDALLLGAAVGGAGGLNSVLKTIVARRRPLSSRSDGGSFPSGHASGSIALAGAALALLWRASPARVPRVILAAAGSGFTAAVGYSRVSLHEHYVGDVLGGYALGAAWLAVLLHYFARTPVEPAE